MIDFIVYTGYGIWALLFVLFICCLPDLIEYHTYPVKIYTYKEIEDQQQQNERR